MKTTLSQQRVYTFNHLWICPQQAHMIVGATSSLIARTQLIAEIVVNETGLVMDEGDEAGHFTLAAGYTVPFRLPFSGMIFTINPVLQTQPDVWRQDPYGLGGLFSMEAIDPAELNLLLNAAQYREIATRLTH